MVDVEQEQDQGPRPRGAERGGVGRVRGSAHTLELEDIVQAGDRRTDSNQDHHRPRRALVDMLKQYVESQSQEDPDGRLEQVGEHAEADQPRIHGHIGGGGGSVAGNVYLAEHVPEGENPRR